MNYQKHRLHENVKYEKLQQQAKKNQPTHSAEHEKNRELFQIYFKHI
jgi:hypothetical protein